MDGYVPIKRYWSRDGWDPQVHLQLKRVVKRKEKRRKGGNPAVVSNNWRKERGKRGGDVSIDDSKGE